MLKKISLIVALFLASISSFADDQVRRTIVVRDGEVLLDDGLPRGKRAFIGVSMTSLTPELREFFGAPKESGVLISSLTENGPAAKAGLRVGDVIVGVNGKTVANHSDLTDAVKDKHAGDSIRLDIIRGKARQTIVVTAEEREMPEIRRFKLGQLERELGPLTAPEWRARLAAPETEELRTRIRDLEKRLQELEKKLQK